MIDWLMCNNHLTSDYATNFCCSYSDFCRSCLLCVLVSGVLNAQLMFHILYIFEECCFVKICQRGRLLFLLDWIHNAKEHGLFKLYL